MSVLASVTTHRELVGNLILRDVKARYKQSVLGYAWAILNPLVLTFVYYLVGGIFLGQANAAFPFPVHVCFGLLFWNLFATGLATATEGLVSHLSLITKIYFPREVFPISAVLSKLVDFGFGLIGLLPLLLVYRLLPAPTLLLTVPLLIIQLFFTMGLGMLCACANLFYRDVRYLVQLTLGIWMYLIPNIYTLDRVEPYPLLYKVYMLNPMAVLIEANRRAAFPQTGSIFELLPYLAITAVVSVGVFIVGYVVFKRYEARFAEFI
ncbi:MAG: ABC transporter permease [Armatimonadaceae bacterium]